MGRHKTLSIEFNEWFEVFYFKLLHDYHMTGEGAAAFFKDNLGDHASKRVKEIILREELKDASIKVGIKTINEIEKNRGVPDESCSER